MNKKIEVIVDKKKEKTIKKLLRKNNRVNTAFEKAKIILRNNSEAGQYVPRDQWPKKLKQEYHLKNLYRYDLIRSRPGWRLLYTITPEGKVKILVVVLRIFDHKSYNRLFGYKS